MKIGERGNKEGESAMKERSETEVGKKRGKQVGRNERETTKRKERGVRTVYFPRLSRSIHLLTVSFASLLLPFTFLCIF